VVCINLHGQAMVPPGRRLPAVLWRLALVACALLAALLPLPSSSVERFYSNGLYQGIQPMLTAASNLVRFSLLDLMIAAVGVGWLALAVRDMARRGQRSRLAAAGSVLLRSVVWTAALYLAFLAVWGLNYRRVRLQDRLPFDASAAMSDGVRALGAQAVDQMNTRYESAHASSLPPLAIDSALAASFARASREINGRGTATVGRPKTTLLNWYFRRAAVDGMTDPYFLETLVAGNLLPIERPFVEAHEWSHLAGLADEGEANFLGWLTCVRGTPAHQYSGWLFLYEQIAATLPRRDLLELQGRLEPGPRSDLRAIADRIRRDINPRVSSAGWRVYDQYLKANRVEAGARSYAEVVRLILGVRFGPDWTLAR
jgi:hypothetical protein